MKLYTRFLSGVWLLTTLVACQPELPTVYAPESVAVGNLEQEFDAYWNGMNNNYIFWDIDPTDWDGVYRRYKPLFAQLKNGDKDAEKARTYYVEMTAQLIDSHYALMFSDNVSIVPSIHRAEQRPNYHSPIDIEHFTKVIPASYLAADSRVGTGTDNDSASYTLVAGKLKNTNVLYFHLSGFALTELYENKQQSAAGVIQYVLDAIQQADLNGIIIDVRSNTGGDSRDINFLTGRLTDKPYVFGALRSKKGMGRLDYLPWASVTVTPPVGSKAFTKPVIVLADMHSISMGEITPMAIKALPGGNAKIVGERTWGAQGPLVENAIYNGGQFTISGNKNIKLVYTSSQMFRYKDGVCYEGLGFPPDVEAPYNGAALKAGKDTQLETAIAQIR